jgi:phage baseplate assembly protein W
MAIVIRSQKFTPTKKEKATYSDISFGFTIHPNTQDLTVTTDEEAVKMSIRNLLLTNRGERFFNPKIGSDIRSLLFENYTLSTENSLKSYVENVVKNYEPRANIISVDVNNYIDDDAIGIRITFSTINSLSPVDLDLFITRVR